MRVASGLERRLEAAIEGLAAMVFGGRVGAAEVSARLAREADLAQFRGNAGPTTANAYVVTLSTADLGGDPASLEVELARALSSYAAERGVRMEGPVEVHVVADPRARPGSIRCKGEVVPGELTPWGRLRDEKQGDLPLRPNRVLVGRAPECDVVVPVPEVSRQHAVVFRRFDEIWVEDLGSSNGTTVDGAAVGGPPARAGFGSLLAVAGHRFRILRCPD